MVDKIFVCGNEYLLFVKRIDYAFVSSLSFFLIAIIFCKVYLFKCLSFLFLFLDIKCLFF